MERRIAYYTRKVIEYDSIHPSKKRNPYRFRRLMLYKNAILRRILNERK